MEKTKENQDTVDRLLELQDLYLKIFALERDMESIPGRVGEIKGRLARYQEDIENGRSVLKSRQAAVKNLELDIDAQRQQTRKYREQQLQLKSNDAFKAINTEIANVEKTISQLEDRQLVCMEDADAAQKEIDRTKAVLAREEGQVQAEIQILEARRNEVESQLAQARAERDRVAAGTDTAWLKPFQRLAEHFKDAAIVRVENGICSGCHLKVPAQIIHDARRSAHVVTCTYCGRMLI